MEATIKEIVSVFIKVPAEQIDPSTPIGRTAVKSSILLHRMYAKLSEQGVRVENYAEMKVFGDLLRGGRGAGDTAVLSAGASAAGSPVMQAPVSVLVPADGAGAGIGVDMEEVASLPRAHDFRKEAFYTENFTAGEIAYCILQVDPYASFAGLFAAKEAMVKAEGSYRTRPFYTIEIGHSSEGRPVHAGFHLSISHAGNMAVAVANPLRQAAPSIRDEAAGAGQPLAAKKGPSSGSPLVWIALLLSVIALILVLQKSFR